NSTLKTPDVRQLDGRSKGRDGTEAEEDGPCDLALERGEARTTTEPHAERHGHQRPGRVADEAKRAESQARHEELHQGADGARGAEISTVPASTSTSVPVWIPSVQATPARRPPRIDCVTM